MDWLDDVTMYCKVTIYFSNLLEDLGDFRNAVQALRSSIQKVVEYREDRLKSGVDSSVTAQTSMSITIDNKKIGELESKIDQVYSTWEGLILRKERDAERKEAELEPLDQAEGDEE